MLIPKKLALNGVPQGIPKYRTRVLYVPQRPSLLPGTPRDFLNIVTSFSSRKNSSKSKHSESISPTDSGHPIEVAKGWGVDEELWDRDWSNLSGGESQRIAMAVAVGLDAAEILLLDGGCQDFSLCVKALTYACDA